ncbi:AAA domain-containing protein [Helicobacter aurati]|uniref:AAA domain-containing protein n=1 Tax=Helicobacter aurati TaxID=137778 RepID=UPI0013154A81|nr:AAA domain-containing protein [Helicobacter aurati]
MSLDSMVDSDILLIQGPPGTGKTTTIVEIVQRYLKANKRDKILVVSQSNQAVDNVLEKICENIKAIRVGKVEKTEDGERTKVSEIA